MTFLLDGLKTGISLSRLKPHLKTERNSSARLCGAAAGHGTGRTSPVCFFFSSFPPSPAPAPSPSSFAARLVVVFEVIVVIAKRVK